jgi:hypothetical protein
MKKSGLITSVCISILLMGSIVSAEETVSGSRLKIYSGGFSLGGSKPVSDSLEAFAEGMGNLSFVNTFFFRENVSFFWDVNWFFPKANLGTDLGIDFVLLTGDVRPFIGAGAGVQYFDKSEEFSDNIGPSAVIHAGVAFELTDAVDVKVFVPYHIVMNKTRDQTVGVQFALMFSNRFKKVKKLEYNN